MSNGKTRAAKRWLEGCLGLFIGAATVALAVAAGTHADGWRVDVYFGACVISGLYLGWTMSANRLDTLGAIAGQFIAAFVWADAVGIGGGSFSLVWPLFVVPLGVAVMCVAAVVVDKVLRSRRGASS